MGPSHDPPRPSTGRWLRRGHSEETSRPQPIDLALTSLQEILGLVEAADAVMEDFLGPMTLVPDNPGSFVKLASRGALRHRSSPRASLQRRRGVFAGLAAHAIAPFNSPLTGGVALLFGVAAHAYGWPMARGGSQRIAEALAKIIVDGGGSIETGRMVSSSTNFRPATRWCWT